VYCLHHKESTTEAVHDIIVSTFEFESCQKIVSGFTKVAELLMTVARLDDGCVVLVPQVDGVAT
jgi:hypothetical protein